MHQYNNYCDCQNCRDILFKKESKTDNFLNNEENIKLIKNNLNNETFLKLVDEFKDKIDSVNKK